MTLFGLESLDAHWLWLIAAVLFGIAEVVAPGIFLIWVGLAALITAVVTLVLPLPVAGQFALFALAAFASVYVGRRIVRSNPIASSDPKLNDRAARMIGEIVTAVEPVDATGGRVKVGDSVWSARGASAAIGERVRIVGLDGGILIVEAV